MLRIHFISYFKTLQFVLSVEYIYRFLYKIVIIKCVDRL